MLVLALFNQFAVASVFSQPYLFPICLIICCFWLLHVFFLVIAFVVSVILVVTAIVWLSLSLLLFLTRSTQF